MSSNTSLRSVYWKLACIDIIPQPTRLTIAYPYDGFYNSTNHQSLANQHGEVAVELISRVAIPATEV